MREVIVQVVAEERTARQAYDLICDFRRYPELTDKVNEVVVHPPEADGSLRSDWSVIFRNGLMRWSELDRFVPETLTVQFEQIKGDFEVFRGSWACEEREQEGGDGVTVVTFRSDFDLAVWSSASADYVTAVVAHLFGTGYPLRFVWGRSRATLMRLMPDE